MVMKPIAMEFAKSAIAEPTAMKAGKSAAVRPTGVEAAPAEPAEATAMEAAPAEPAAMEAAAPVTMFGISRAGLEESGGEQQNGCETPRRLSYSRPGRATDHPTHEPLHSNQAAIGHVRNRMRL
jgi:hypothetical protein